MSVVRWLRNTIVEALLRDPRTSRIERGVEDVKILLGQQTARSRPADPRSWRDVEFRVFSQFGDDGIVDYLAERIRPVETFVELGVGDYTESNTRFLLVNRQWRGFICDGNTRLMNRVRQDAVSWQFGLQVSDRWIALRARQSGPAGGDRSSAGRGRVDRPDAAAERRITRSVRTGYSMDARHTQISTVTIEEGQDEVSLGRIFGTLWSYRRVIYL